MVGCAEQIPFGVQRKSRSSELVKGLVVLGITKCYCSIVTAPAHTTNVFHSNLLFTGETKVRACLLCTALQPATGRMAFLFRWDSVLRVALSWQICPEYQSPQAHPGSLICLEFNQTPYRLGRFNLPLEASTLKIFKSYQNTNY